MFQWGLNTVYDPNSVITTLSNVYCTTMDKEVSCMPHKKSMPYKHAVFHFSVLDLTQQYYSLGCGRLFHQSSARQTNLTLIPEKVFHLST